MAKQPCNRGSAIWFLTEQACCLVLVQGKETDDFNACRQAVEFLAGDDKKTVAEFLERTGAIEGNPGDLADYDLRDYCRKERDLLGAVYELLTCGHDTSVPEGTRTALLKSAEIIASFYGAETGPFALPREA